MADSSLANAGADAPCIDIRPYRPDDWARLCDIHDRARLQELRLSAGEAAFLTLEDAASNEGLFDGELAVAVVADVVRGFVAYDAEELTWLYVDPDAQGRGIGRALVRHAMASSSAPRMVQVLEGNAPALALYRSKGFTVRRRVVGRLEGNEAFAATGLVLECSEHGPGS